MTAERWAQIKDVFGQTLEQPASTRESFLRQLSNGDTELYEEALAMIRNSGEAGMLLDLSLLGRQWVRPAALARTLTPGKTLAGRYRIVRPIGAGGMGEVYEAEDLDLGARVAVKTMRVEDEDALARFKREIQLARTVTHPNVCRIFDLHRHHDPESGSVVTFLTMELVEGETLSEYIGRRGALTAGEALPIAWQVAMALAAAHEKRVVHRDLKARNVILADNGLRAVVTDFGLAHTLTQATESTVTVVGTPAYMAPEQFEGKPVTAAVDIYAFGVLLYEMVVGRSPFAGDSPIALALEKIRKEPPRASDAVPGLPSVWSAVISRCLDPKPERRFSDVRDALRRLQESVNRPPLIRLSRTHKRVLASCAIAAGLLALTGWRYTQSTYAPAGEALRLYRHAAHAHQLGLPWKASQLYERASENDSRFIAARASLAEVWMDLDQPRRARTELERAAAIRPRWQRVAEYESLLERAADARLRGALTDSVILHQRATEVAPETDKPEVLLGEAMARTRTGDVAGAIARYASVDQGARGRCTAMLAHAVLIYPAQPIQTRTRFENSVNCFETSGDLDGVAQSWYEYGRAEYGKGERGRAIVDMVQRAASTAQSSGNIEQEILTAALLAEMMLELGDDEAAYTAFSRGMQIADRNGLSFISARLLDARAEYHFNKGEILQSENFGALASFLSRSAGMPLTFTRCMIRNSKLSLRMELPDQARVILARALGQLQQFPNVALAAEVTKLLNAARNTRPRSENSVYQAPQ